MSRPTVESPGFPSRGKAKPGTGSWPSSPPPLNAGDRLSRAEFERLYQAHPEIKKAELIEGVVYMASPVRFAQHSRPHIAIVTWLGVYEAATPGVSGGTTPRCAWDSTTSPSRTPCCAWNLNGEDILTSPQMITWKALRN